MTAASRKYRATPRKTVGSPARAMVTRIRRLTLQLADAERDLELLMRVSDGHERRVVELEGFLRGLATILDETKRPKSAGAIRKMLGEKKGRAA